jgi:hypothetical protein
MRIKGLPSGMIYVKHYVLYALDEMLLYVQFVLWELFIEILLESLEPDGIPIFVFAIVLSVLLKTVVCQMHIVILIIEGVGVRTRAKITFPIHVKLLFM